MKRFFAICAICLIAFVIILFGTLALVSRSNTVHQFIISHINKTIPGTFSIDQISISPFSIKVEINNVLLADSSGKELAVIRRLFVDISSLSLLRKKLLVRHAVLEYPRVVLDADSSGTLSIIDAIIKKDSLPQDTTTSTSEDFSLPMSIDVRHLELIGASVIFDAAYDSISIGTHGLSIKADGESGTFSANVEINFDSLNLAMKNTEMCLYDLSLMTRIREKNIDTVTVSVRTAESVLSIFGNAKSLFTGQPAINALINAKIALSDVASFTGGDVAMNGSVALGIACSGRIDNPDKLGITVTSGSADIMGYNLDTLHIDLDVTDRVLQINPFMVKSGIGSTSVTGSIDARTFFPDGYLSRFGSMQGLAYQLDVNADRITLDTLVSGMYGIADVAVRLDGKGVDPGSLVANVVLSAEVDSFCLDSRQLPLDAAIACSATVSTGEASVHKLDAELGDTKIALTGKYHLSKGTVDGATDLTVPSIAALLGCAFPVDSLNGKVKLSASIAGDIKHPRAHIDLAVDSLVYKTMMPAIFALEARLDNDGVATVNRLDAAINDSRLFIRGSAGVLDNGVPVAVDKMKFNCQLESPGISTSDFIDSVAARIMIDAAVSGTMSDMHGHLRLDSKEITVAGQTIERVHLNTLIEGQRAIIDSLEISAFPGTDVIINGWASFKDSFNITLSGKEIGLAAIPQIASVIDSLDGIASITVRADGTYNDPKIDGMLGVKDIFIGSIPIEDIDLGFEFKNNRAKVKGKALADIEAEYGITDKKITLKAVIDSLLLKPFMAVTGLDLDGVLTAAVSLSGCADSLAAADGSFEIKTLDMNYNGKQVIETHNLRIDLSDKQYYLPDFKILLAGEGELTGRASGSIEGVHDAALKGTVPLTVARYFSSDFDDIEGRVDIDASFKGTLRDNDLKAEVRPVDIAMTIPGITQRLHSINGSIVATRDAVRIESIRAGIGSGVFTLTGDLKLKELAPADLKADITMDAVPVGMPDMLDLLVNSKLRISGTPDTTIVSGVITLLDGLYYQDIIINPLASMNQPRRRKEAPPPQEITLPYLRNMLFNIDLSGRSPFRVDNNIAQLYIQPDLQLSGTLAAPALNGRAAVEQGSITYLKRIFTVDKGVIDFVNPYAIEPQIDIHGTVPVKERVIAIKLSGGIEDLQFALSSNDPSLEDQDIILLLVLGKTSSDLKDGDIGGQSPEQMLASLVASTFGDDLKNATGLDLIEVETGNADNKNSDRISVTVGKDITRRLRTKYTIESEEAQVVQRATAEYRILEDLLISGFQDTRGVNGGELRFIWERR
ncbi:MAG: translocation/assembly module TamB domain-containing protein [Chitinispirillaceae bacterium]|nr:translocation/assembly module TamB domain-containing protein [Chitinispirillaceae bacterium]